MSLSKEGLQGYYKGTRERILKKGTRWGAFTGLLPGDKGENIKEGNQLGSVTGLLAGDKELEMAGEP